MAKLNISPKAQDDLSEIKQYVEKESGSPQIATKYAGKIMKKIRSLSDFPEIGAALNSIVDIKTDYRFIVCESYIAFYRFDGKEVYVDRVLHGKRNYLKILGFPELDNN